MKKHLFGLALFLSITSAAVLLYSYFNVPPIPVIPAVDYPKDSSASYGGKYSDLKKIAYNVSAAELDIKERVFRAHVDLKWNGKKAPASPLYMSFYLINSEGERNTFLSKTVYAENWFANGDDAGMTIVIEDVDMSFARQDNLYTFIEFSTDGKVSSRPDERVGLAKLTPVLMFHDGQKVLAAPVRSGR